MSNKPANIVYETAIEQLNEKGNVEDWEKILKTHEGNEEYEVCADIKRAIKEYTNSK